MTDRIKSIMFRQRYRLIRHSLFWLVYFIVFSVESGVDLGNWRLGIETTLCFTPINLLFVYVILFWLVPRYLVKERYLTFLIFYVTWVVMGLVMNFLFRYYILIPFRSGRPSPPIGMGGAYRMIFALGSFIVMNTVAAFAVFISMFKYWYREQRQKMQIQEEKTRAELELLKAQLHPHFLFNTLNNLYTLVIERSEKAPDMLLRLSGLLSYVLYECKAPEVSLEKEIKVMLDYIALEQERYGSRLEISTDFSGDLEGKMIAPMMFQPFVENAFKHGTAEQIGRVWMSIELSVRKNQLIFRVINSVDWKFAEKKAGGIGIENVRRRLELLYPGKYTLEQDAGEETYIISLTIELGFSAPVRNWLVPVPVANQPNRI
jgi:sensor histidine kinase YesM